MARSGLLDLVPGDGGRAALLAEERYWDALVRGEPLSGGSIDPALAATIQRLYDLDDAPLPDVTFVARLESELLGRTPFVRPVLSAPDADSRSAPPARVIAPLHVASPSRRLAMNLAATAALLAIVVASMFVALRAGPLAPHDRETPPLVLAPGITDEKLLLQARFDTFPDSARSAAIYRWVLQPGAEMTRGRPRKGEVAASAFLVESGTLTVVPDEPIAVTRAGATTPVAVPGSTAVTLLPGDKGFTQSGVTSRWRNDGTAPVRVMEATFASRDLDPPAEGGLVYQVIDEWPYQNPDHPLLVSVIAITLHPEGALSAETIPGLAMLKVESGRLAAIDVDGLGNPLPPILLGQGTRFLNSFPPGRTFRSGNDEPVRLLLVTITDANPLAPGG